MGALTDDEIERLVDDLATKAFDAGAPNDELQSVFDKAEDDLGDAKVAILAAIKALRAERDVAQANEALLWERLGYAESEIERLKMEML